MLVSFKAVDVLAWMQALGKELWPLALRLDPSEVDLRVLAGKKIRERHRRL